MKSEIAILGGTFDPIHLGHLLSANHVKNILSVKEVRLVPSSQPPHKKLPESSADHRLEMLRLAVEDFPGIVIDDREICREGPSYSVDTLNSLRSEVGLREAIYLVMGMDAFSLFDDWHRCDDICELCHIIVLKRPGYDVNFSGEMNDWMKDRICSLGQFNDQSGGKVCLLELEQVDISSTEIREAFHRGLKPSMHLTSKVENYIQRHGLYRGEHVNA